MFNKIFIVFHLKFLKYIIILYVSIAKPITKLGTNAQLERNLLLDKPLSETFAILQTDTDLQRYQFNGYCMIRYT